LNEIYKKILNENRKQKRKRKRIKGRGVRFWPSPEFSPGALSLLPERVSASSPPTDRWTPPVGAFFLLWTPSLSYTTPSNRPMQSAQNPSPPQGKNTYIKPRSSSLAPFSSLLPVPPQTAAIHRRSPQHLRAFPLEFVIVGEPEPPPLLLSSLSSTGAPP
jgi:hypothetical protein